MAKCNFVFHENYVLLDIEGTTSSISFIKDILFPFYRENLDSYVSSNWNEAEFQSDLTLLINQCAEDIANEVSGVVPIVEGNQHSVIQNVLWQMNLNRKATALKTLEGHMFRNGVQSGKLKGHIFDDVKPALESWRHNGKKLYIYSSGSIEAQKLLFGNSVYGNMLELFTDHFDTTVGSKVDASSYENIARIIGCPTNDILFITDVVKEAEAASKAGCRVIISVRPGNSPLSDEDKSKYLCIQSFNYLIPE